MEWYDKLYLYLVSMPFLFYYKVKNCINGDFFYFYIMLENTRCEVLICTLKPSCYSFVGKNRWMEHTPRQLV